MSGNIPWRRKLQTIPVFLPGKSHEQRSLGGLQSMGSQRVKHKKCVCVCVCVCALVTQWCLTVCNPMDCSSPRLLCPWNSPDENIGVGSHSLLKGIFPTQGLNPGLALWADSLPSESPEKPIYMYIYMCVYIRTYIYIYI